VLCAPRAFSLGARGTEKKDMSNIQNQTFIERAYDEFQMALEEENFGQAHKLLDMMFDCGFNAEAVSLGKQLLKRKMSATREETCAHGICDGSGKTDEGYADDIHEVSCLCKTDKELKSNY
jgi:hypothetical protein